MKSKISVFISTAICGGVALGLATTTQADLIQNGQFTSLSLVSPQPGNAATLDAGGQLGYNINADNWNITSGYTFVFNPDSISSGVNGQYGNLSLYTSGDANNAANGGLGDVIPAPNGGNILASDGAFQLEPITQTITGLTPGDQYNVTYYFAGAQQHGFSSPTSEAWYVKLGNGSFVESPVVDNANHGFTGWEKTTATLTADSTTDVLTFLAYGTPSGVPPFSLLSDISMEQVVAPEPSSVIGGGLVVLALGVGSFRKFRQQKQA